MREKKIIMGIVCIVFSITTAFSTTQFIRPTSSTAFVKVRAIIAGAILCIATDKQCDEVSASIQCQVTVQTTSGPMVTRAYRSGCVVLLFTVAQPTGTFTPSPIPVVVVQ